MINQLKSLKPQQQSWLIFSMTSFVFIGTFWWSFTAQNVSPEEALPRTPAQAFQSSDVLDKIRQLKKDISNPAIYNAQTCETYIQSEYQKVFELNVESFDDNSIILNSDKILNAVFALRLALREQYAKLTGQSGFRESCAFAHRKAFRAMRVLEDYLGEAALGFPYNNYYKNREKILKAELPEITIPAFQSASTNTLWNPKYKPADLKYVPQDGDLILSRGNASTSAAIARITDEDSNFSHLSVVRKNPETNRFETMEAHIEIGSKVFDYEKDYINDKKVRAVVFRLKDPSRTDEQNTQLASQAAQAIRSHVLNYQKKFGKNICYNFSMDMNIENCLFCSQLASYAFKLVDPSFNMPRFQSTLNPKNTSFLNMMGVTARRTFAPADIELDPRFELVAEWRDYNRLHHAHHLDAILTSMYKWMDDLGYQLNPSFSQQLQGNFGYVLRRIPLVETISGMDEKFPLNMPGKTIKGVQALNAAVNALKAYIEDEELKSNGVKRLSPRQMMQKLDAFRPVEYSDWQADASSPFVDAQINPQYRFHDYFRPKN